MVQARVKLTWSSLISIRHQSLTEGKGEILTKHPNLPHLDPFWGGGGGMQPLFTSSTVEMLVFSIDPKRIGNDMVLSVSRQVHLMIHG